MATFGYWNIRGLAQPIRFLLAFTDTEVTEQRYEYGPAPTWSRAAWEDVKYTLGLDFPNIPYYIDAEVKLTQSLAIMRHVARKNNLDGNNEREKARIDLIEQQLSDYRGAFSGMCYNPDFDALKVNYLKNLPARLKALSDFLSAYQWLAGETFSYVDFILYEFLDQTRIFSPSALDDFANLREFVERFENLPKIAAYLKSDKYLKWPLNGAMAQWGGRDSKK